ncbi:MAG: dihydrodipicolinate synthase family protein [Tagaea sp.]|nr:dihydrodipicolinate synthase family protein [Tagaea sp.]
MTIEKVRTALRGISGIHVTPYGADGGIDEALTARICRRIAQAGVHNIVSGGNTGEFFSLTAGEVDRLQAAAFAAIGDGALRTAAVGRSLAEARATARQAVAAGAQALMIHHPADPFAAPSAQADYFLSIAEDARVPVMAYLRSDTIPVAELKRVASHPNMAGIKFASTNLMLLTECVRQTADTPCVWVCGLAEGWAPAHYAAGARGFTSGLINVAPERSLAIWKALDEGRYDAARALIDPIAGFEQLRTRHNNGANVTVVKEALMLQGFPVGPARLPNLPKLDAADRTRLEGLMATLALPG